MKRYIYLYLTFVILLGVLQKTSAQYCNEWIVLTQSYWKISVAEDAIYRINASQLFASGFPTTIDPRRIQVFHRGQEQAVRIINEADGIFDATDYIEFYGKRNDGTQDVGLYFTNSTFQVNPYYNNYSDTTAFFVTFQNATLGKRMPTSNLPNLGYTPESEHLQLSTSFFASEFSPGRNFFATTTFSYISNYDSGEGFTSSPIYQGQSRDITIPIQNYVSSGQAPTIEISTVSRLYYNSDITISVGASVGSLRTIRTFTNSDYQKNVFTQTLLNSDLPAPNGNLVVRFSNTASIFNAFSITYIKVTYPQTLNANGSNQVFYLKPKPTNVSYIEVVSPPPGSSLYNLTDPNNIVLIQTSTTTTLNAVVGNTLSSQKLFLTNEFKSVLKVEKSDFLNFNPANFDYLIVSHPKLMQPALSYSNPVQGFADYRASAAGGGHKPLVADVTVLYNQFNYGEKSPMAIRNFAKFCYDNGKPEHLFLIGYAIIPPANDAQYGTSYFTPYNIRTNSSHEALNLVPTFGHPGSDFPFTSGFDAYVYAPAIPTGRLISYTPLEVAQYLNKVKEYEVYSGGDLWRKNVLHLSGGIREAEYTLFRAYLDFYKSLAEGDFLKGIVKTAAKRTTENVEFVDITAQINEGTILTTFFGHSGVTITDIEVGFVSDDNLGYRNKGKYTVVLGNGCELGAVYEGRGTQAQDWILTPDRGAVGWIAQTSLGFASVLNGYSSRFYSAAFANPNTYASSLGKLTQLVCRSYGTTSIPDLSTATAQQMALQGDPAIRFFPEPKPDYFTQNSWLSVSSWDNSPLTARSDSLQLKVISSNIGMHSTKKFEVSVKQTLSNGNIIDHTTDEIFNPIIRVDTLVFNIKRPQGISFAGNNRIDVKIDYKDSIPEYKEDNNVAFIEFILPDAGVKALFPSEYSVVNSQPLSLIAEIDYTQATNRSIVFELDTTFYFNSPAKRTQTVQPQGNIAMWQTNLLTNSLPSDSVVYYWRVNFADAVGSPESIWDESSFIYIKDSPNGWSQSHIGQFRKSTDNGLSKNFIQQKWEFLQTQNRIRATTYGANHPTKAGQVSIKVNDLSLVNTSDFVPCQNNAFLLVQFQSDSKSPYQPANRVRVCGKSPSVVSSFSNADIQSGIFESVINNIPTNDYYLLVTYGQITTASWNYIKPKLQALGSSPAALGTLQQNHPYIILGQKGGSLVAEKIAPSILSPTQDSIALDYNFGGGFTKGTAISTRIGPALQWGAFFQKVKAIETSASPDVTQISIFGEQANGQRTLLVPNVALNTFSYDLSGINASSYPYLRLQFYTRDSVNLTPSQLKKWQVLYDIAPEGFMNVSKVEGGANSYKVPDKQEGDRFTLPFAFENISTKNFSTDSLLVEVSNLNRKTNQITKKSFNIKAPKVGEVTKFDYTVLNSGNVGSNALKVYVNPKVVAEQYYENNIIEIPYNVISDEANPILEVTFDGAKIMDGEVVSPSPLIHVRIRDENQYLVKKDTTGLDIRVQKPCPNCPFERIAFSSSQVRWRSEGGTTEIDYHPQNLPNGIYKLQVQGEDAKGNKAGVQPYRISFEVVNESTVTNVLPYPNPFSSSTRFVFTLTGKEVPDEMKIQIMTVSGKVVREITQAELGGIRIGNNLSQYAWDGTDEFGDKLANGVYLYKVTMKSKGEIIQQRSTAADKAFKQGYGKLYILR